MWKSSAPANAYIVFEENYAIILKIHHYWPLNIYVMIMVKAVYIPYMYNVKKNGQIDFKKYFESMFGHVSASCMKWILSWVTLCIQNV